jgi:hypothetical protein
MAGDWGVGNLANSYFPRGFAHSSRSKITVVFSPPLRCGRSAVHSPQPPVFHRAIEAERRPDNGRFFNMATIGSFIAKDGKITGKIQTLALNVVLTFLPTES